MIDSDSSEVLQDFFQGIFLLLLIVTPFFFLVADITLLPYRFTY